MENYPFYQSIGRHLQHMIVVDSRSYRGQVSNEEFLAVAAYWSEMIQNNDYHRALARPDFDLYNIDFKIWEHFFAMNTTNNWVSFPCVDPRGPLDMPDMNPFPVTHYSPRTADRVPIAPAQQNTAPDVGASTQAPASALREQLPAYHHGLSAHEMEHLARREVNERLRRGVKGRSTKQSRFH
ncbi:uncharacterized protein EAE97_011098 [Botrytis byssoidea]|uniref:Uncharacterized protein n=1 Tax=Botrytis byssoidea TaxID=139641 RepID=A0A9P5HT95_9HELO|nr:uncharacterized protein EAE97_011098 [Botrytis byssoidea]KAF7922356.1 hypothetical protein EAE97_011098 [Botrytis byssoidea]